MRTQAQIQADLDAAYALDLTFRLGTAEYKANRLRIGELMRELQAAYLAETRPMTDAEMLAEYNVPDWEQSYRERRERERLPVQASIGFFGRPALERTLGMDDDDYIPMHCPCKNTMKMCARCIAMLDAKLTDDGKEAA